MPLTTFFWVEKVRLTWLAHLKALSGAVAAGIIVWPCQKVTSCRQMGVNVLLYPALQYSPGQRRKKKPIQSMLARHC